MKPKEERQSPRQAFPFLSRTRALGGHFRVIPVIPKITKNWYSRAMDATGVNGCNMQISYSVIIVCV
jgi:hypothetical protein